MESGGTATGLGFHHFGTGILNALGHGSHFLSGEAGAFNLGEQRQNGHATVTADDVDAHLVNVQALGFGHEGLATDHIQGGHAEQATLVIDTGFLQHFGGDGDRGVDRVGDDADQCFRAGSGTLFHQVLDDTGVDVEQVGTVHAGLARHAGRDQHDIGADQSRARIFTAETFYFHVSRDVAQVRRHARSDRGNVIQAQFGTGRQAVFQQQSEGLADATGGTQNGNFHDQLHV
jgi:hypothetical protein